MPVRARLFLFRKKKLTAKQQVSSPLIDGALQAVAAAKLLPADKELAALAAKLDGRAKAIAVEVAVIKKDVAAKQAVATTTGQKFKAAESSRAGILKRHDAAVAVVAAAFFRFWKPANSTFRIFKESC